jgi:hypothetical protein
MSLRLNLWLSLQHWSSATNQALLTIDGEQIEEVQSMKYLGVQIDNKLAFKEHLNLIVKKNRQEDDLFGTKLEKTYSPHQDNDLKKHYPTTLGLLVFNYVHGHKWRLAKTTAFTKPSPPYNPEKNQEERRLDGCLTHSGCTQSSRE